MFEISLKQLKILINIFDFGGVTGAARALKTHQPTVSRVLRDVEKKIGGAIFEKHQARLILTKRGERLFEYAKLVLTQTDRLSADIRLINKNEQNFISFGVDIIAADSVIAPSIKQIKEKFPNFAPMISEGKTRDLCAELVEGRHDFLVSTLPKDLNPSLEYEVLFSCSLGIFGRSGHPIFYDDKNPIERVPNFPWIFPSDPSHRLREMDRFFEYHQIQRPQVGVTTMSPAVEKKLLLENDWLILAQYNIFIEEIQSGAVKVVNPHFNFNSIDVALIKRNSMNLSLAHETLLKAIRQESVIYSNIQDTLTEVA